MNNLIQKYGGAVPRYTSYPTSVQFHDKITATDAGIFLKNRVPRNPVSLYIHIPFCHSLCHYCGCHTKIVNHTSVISSYIETLCQEIRLVASGLAQPPVISRIHFGGGSPNYAPVQDIKKILDTIHAVFPGNDSVQIDMECDPRLLTSERISDLSTLGLHRVSLGIQDFDPVVQQAVNRIQTVAHVRQQVENLRLHGINNINFDLIVGLPEQTKASVKNTLEETLKLRPSRIAVFAYAHVPWMKKHQKILEKYRFPTQDERLSMQEGIWNILCNEGYQSIGIDHYALPQDTLSQAYQSGTVRRNFQGYTDDPASVTLGFGLSAISEFEGAYTQNTLDATTYRKAIEKGMLPTQKGYILSQDEINTKKIIMQIMCRFHVDLDEYNTPWVESEQLAALEKDGIITRLLPHRIDVTDKGRLFARVVASCFDTHFQKNKHTQEDRHAKAV